MPAQKRRRHSPVKAKIVSLQEKYQAALSLLQDARLDESAVLNVVQKGTVKCYEDLLVAHMKKENYDCPCDFADVVDMDGMLFYYNNVSINMPFAVFTQFYEKYNCPKELCPAHLCLDGQRSNCTHAE